MEPQTHDFIAETKGYCFLCSKVTSFVFKSESPCSLSSSSSIYSFHSLSRYLKVDMGKVFTGDGPIPPHLLARVQKSRLKTELCEGCADLTEKLTNLLRQMEKVEMEVASCLAIIHGKLEGASKLATIAKVESWNESSTDEWTAKLEITDALREDVKQKCHGADDKYLQLYRVKIVDKTFVGSRKLEAVLPLTKLQRLTPDQIKAKMLKIESLKVATKISQWSTQNQHPESTYEVADIKRSASVSVSDGDGNDCLDEPEDFTYSPIHYESSMPEQEVNEGKSISDGMELDVDIKTEPVSGQQQPISTANEIDIEQQQRFRTNVKNIEANQLSQAIPPAIIVESGDGTVEKPDVIKNPKTGKYKCSSCPREYALIGGFRFHYKSAHLKVRFECGICKNQFSYKQNYESHYLGVHMGVRFKCLKCEKTFTEKSSLIKHQKSHRNQ